MGVVVVGSVALDSVQTPFGKRNNALGGSATYFSLSARFFTDVKMVATVGTDFPKRHVQLFKKSAINTDGLEVKSGKTFKWKCRYEYDMNVAHTVYTRLNVFKDFSPHLPLSYRKDRYIFLANIDPDLQENVLRQIRNPKLIACDTMNHWIKGKRKSLVRLLGAVDILFLNDAEARELTQESNVLKAIRWIFKRGPKVVIVKKGEHGVVFATEHTLFSIPAYPLEEVCDPTGAGDTFAGGFMGYVSRSRRLTDAVLKKAIVYGTIMASFAVERFGPQRLINLNSRSIEARYRTFRALTKF
jgi:sugar/nucleoside kinase (ribokinase family)